RSSISCKPFGSVPLAGLVEGEERRTNRKEHVVTDTTQVPAPAETEAAMAMPQPLAPGELPLSIRALLEAGVHFGHQTKRWNPKMRTFIFGARNGVHIIDLDQTARLFRRAYDFLVDTVGRGGAVLFVGTKRQAQDIVQEEA